MEKTAKIMVKANKTDPVYQSILVRETGGVLEYYHRQFLRWVTLPSAWETEAKQALATMEAAS